MPDGQRSGFTFNPVKHSIPGLIYYTPAWLADPGVSYTLESADALLTLAGEQLYELKTGKPYNPASGEFGVTEYTLKASDGTVYKLSTASGVREQITPDGNSLIYSDSGITSATGDSIKFIKDIQKRLTKIIGSDGSEVNYTYDNAGDLIAVRSGASGESIRYGYSLLDESEASGDSTLHLLNLVAKTGEAGEAISYNNLEHNVFPVIADLGSASQFSVSQINDNLVGGEIDRYSFSFRDSEINSTNENLVLLGVEVKGHTGSGLSLDVPSIKGLTPLVTHKDGDSAFGLFGVERSGLNLVELSGENGGNYGLQLFVAGDINGDGLVDGTDSQSLMGAVENGQYAESFDLNRDGFVNAGDVQILGGNFGFTANRAPVVTPNTVLTHEDLETTIALEKLAIDPEDDIMNFQVLNPVNGTVQLSPNGRDALFLPSLGYAGTASFDILASDGFSSSTPTTITVNISDAPLVNLDFASRNPKLRVGESTELVVMGDFADTENVILPDSYLTFTSENGGVANVSTNGKVTGLIDGTSILSVSRDNLQTVTAVRVGELATPTNQAELNIALAEEDGLKLYPEAVTLTEGMTRQLLVGLDESFTPDLRATSDGTRYFVSNPAVLQVNSNRHLQHRNSTAIE